eukprot:Nitzschia sp. Nitz4//scaffold485_size5303//233//968//NITZ4_009229-RA/size5303-snap-gene-0.0-mRNA-1//1//CDS//3329552890//1939//frame0
MKKDAIGKPKYYLGAKVTEVTLENGVKAWGMSSSKYIQVAVRKSGRQAQTEGRKLIARGPTPFPVEYAPELDTSRELEAEEANFFQSQIGILHWMVELGRIDIMMEVSISRNAIGFYGDVKEAIPMNAPKPRGKEVDLQLFVDSSHGDDKVNRRSRSGYFIFMNNAPIAWLSKKQATIETSVFGAKFVAMKIGMEIIRG